MWGEDSGAGLWGGSRGLALKDALDPRLKVDDADQSSLRQAW